VRLAARMGGLARRQPRLVDRHLDQDRQEGEWRPERGSPACARERADLRLDRRPARPSGRNVLPAKVHATPPEESLVADQRREGRGADPRGPDAAGRPGAGRGGEGRRPLGRRLRAAEPVVGARRPAPGARRQPGRGRALRQAEQPEPLRRPLPSARRQAPRDAGAAARRDGGDAERRADLLPDAPAPAPTRPRVAPPGVSARAGGDFRAPLARRLLAQALAQGGTGWKRPATSAARGARRSSRRGKSSTTTGTRRTWSRSPRTGAASPAACAATSAVRPSPPSPRSTSTPAKPTTCPPPRNSRPARPPRRPTTARARAVRCIARRSPNAVHRRPPIVRNSTAPVPLPPGKPR